MNLFEYAEQQPRYPIKPGYKARSTSLSAAKSMNGKAPRLQQLIVDQLRTFGPLTTDECAGIMDVDKLAVRPRFSELSRLGRIEDTGKRRANGSGRSAIVWRLVR